MNTPDAGRIRVRWYAVDRPPPGTYDLTDYCSSNWDESPHSLDPTFGEESTSRQPFTDWCDCSQPPWDCPLLRPSPAFAAGGPDNFVMPFDATPFGPEAVAVNGTWWFRYNAAGQWIIGIPGDGPNFLRGAVGNGFDPFLNGTMNFPMFPAGTGRIDLTTVDGPLPDSGWTFTLTFFSPTLGVLAAKAATLPLCGLTMTTETGSGILTEDGKRIITEA